MVGPDRLKLDEFSMRLLALALGMALSLGGSVVAASTAPFRPPFPSQCRPLDRAAVTATAEQMELAVIENAPPGFRLEAPRYCAMPAGWSAVAVLKTVDDAMVGHGDYRYAGQLGSQISPISPRVDIYPEPDGAAFALSIMGGAGRSGGLIVGYYTLKAPRGPRPPGY